jgi:NADH-quinone oxidoreductase subunit J
MYALTANDLLFYILGAVALFGAVAVVMFQNPIFAALSLAASMIAVAGLFFTLNAYFVAGVQVIVYAGAVMVLFVMVLMLFDLKHEMATFSKGTVSGILKLISCGLFAGMLIGTARLSSRAFFTPVSMDTKSVNESTKVLSHLLFTDYLFGFEVIGALLLMIAIGAVTLSRVQGGTHAD